MLRPLLCPRALAAAPALATESCCNIPDFSVETSDNYPGSDIRLTMAVLASSKEAVRLGDNESPESTILSMGGKTIPLFRNGQENHQLRIDDDGKFNYLIPKPDPQAPGGKDQVPYRGQCVEG